MTGLLEQQVVLITGAGSGIGRATALLAAAEGADVVGCCDVDGEGLRETEQLITQAGAHAVACVVDVTDQGSVSGFVDQVQAVRGRIDGAVNNAGILGDLHELAEMPVDAWRRVLDVNLTGVLLCMQGELKHMLPRAEGAIVNVASAAAFKGLRNYSAYSASKHAVVGLTRTAALEYAQRGIRVNAICPGRAATAMSAGRDALHPGESGQPLVGRALERRASPTEIAEAAVWLLSPRASFVHGQAVRVDGGQVG